MARDTRTTAEKNVMRMVGGEENFREALRTYNQKDGCLDGCLRAIFKKAFPVMLLLVVLSVALVLLAR